MADQHDTECNAKAMPFPVSRRRFLTLGMGLFLGGAVSRTQCGAAQLELVKRSSHALGTKVYLTVLHPDGQEGADAIDSALLELERVEQLMSIYRKDSQLSELNRHGEINNPDPLFVDIMRIAMEWSGRSNGAFDITVQPLWEAGEHARQKGMTPDVAAVEGARGKVDWREMEISASRIRFKKNGMAVTLNGIAQGFATDRVSRVLTARGVEHALIDCGEIGTAGVNSKGQPWKVGIQHPRERDAFISVARLAGRSLATSGDYETTFTPDFRFNHLFDPRTGQSPAELASVTIAAPRATHADALSTAVFVLGPEEGMRLIETETHTDAFLVLKNGRSIATKGFPWSV